jgi:hypothetical protein
MCNYATYVWIKPDGQLGEDVIRKPFCTHPCAEWRAAAAQRDENGNSELSYGLPDCDQDTQEFYVDEYSNLVAPESNCHLRYYVPEMALKRADMFRPVNWNPPRDYISEGNRVANAVDPVAPKSDTIVTFNQLQADKSRPPQFGSVQSRRKRDLSPDSRAVTHSCRSYPKKGALDNIPRPSPTKMPCIRMPFGDPAPCHAMPQSTRTESMEVVLHSYQHATTEIPSLAMSQPLSNDSMDIYDGYHPPATGLLSSLLADLDSSNPAPLSPHKPARSVNPPSMKYAPYRPFADSCMPKVIDASNNLARVVGTPTAFDRPNLTDVRRPALKRKSSVGCWGDADGEYEASCSEDEGLEDVLMAVKERPQRQTKMPGREKVERLLR